MTVALQNTADLPLGPADLERDVRTRLFAGSHTRAWRVGVELELIPLRATDRQPVPVEESDGSPATLPWLRRVARDQGWREGRSGYGIPTFTLPQVGVLFFEPGGQLELSTVPFRSPSELLATATRLIQMLTSSANDVGIQLLEIGLDPVNPVSSVPMRFDVPRYSRMATHFDRVGTAGARMMRQTASCQVSVDIAAQDFHQCWRAFNALAPVIIATFANSPLAGGSRGGDASTRARIWQQLDPTRTGVFTATDGPAEYTGFALGAAAFMLGEDSAAARPLGEWVRNGAVTKEIWHEHLSTLFPEVRPRGYLEVRACDMVGSDARAALLILLCAVARNAAARGTIMEIVGPPDENRYREAPTADAQLVSLFRDVLTIAIYAARSEETGFWASEDLAAAERFVHSYAARGRTPADDWKAESWSLPRPMTNNQQRS
jgi:glutamate--cysteine ligase